jgi:DNA-binding transcriptional LysR family regulator
VDFDLNLLRIFAVVVDEGSLSAAARKLDLPVSSVSRALSRLEEDVGTQLIVRTTRQMKLTATGEGLYQAAAPLLTSLLTEVSRVTEHTEAPAGELRITAPVELGQAFLAEAVTKFTARYPGVSVHAHLTNDVVDLVKEGMDLALRFSGAQLKDSALVATKVSPLTGFLYASPAYLARKGTPRTPAELAGHEWVLFTRGQLRTMQLTWNGTKVEVKPKGRVSASEILYVRELLRNGMGIGFLPAFLALDDAGAGTLVRVLPKASLYNGYVWIVRPVTKHVPQRVTAFRDFIVEYLKAHPLAQ